MSQTTPCRTCGAQLAPDQRYCLGCGTRVAAPRLDFVAETERAEAEARNGSAPGVAVVASNGAAGAGAGEAGAGAAGAAVPGADVPGAGAAGAAGPAAAAAAPSLLDRIGGPMGVAAIALVSLGVGFLLGQVRVAEPTARAPVVKIENAAPSGGGETAAGAAGATGGADSGTAAGQSGGVATPPVDDEAAVGDGAATGSDG